MLALLASHFRKIKLIGGNHDSRPRKLLAEHLPPEVLDSIALTGPIVFQPLQFLAAGRENVEVVAPIKSDFATFSSRSSSTNECPGRTYRATSRWAS